MTASISSLLLALAVQEPRVVEPRTEPPPSPVVELVWTAPAGCPERQAVLDAIERLVGRPLGQDPTRTLGVVGRIEREAGGEHRLSLELRLPDGAPVRRELRARGCDALLEPAAVVVAVAVDPHGEDPMTTEDAEAPASVPEAPPAPPDERLADEEGIEPRPVPLPAESAEPDPIDDDLPPPRSAPPPRARARPRAVLGAAGGIAVGTVPRVGASVEAGAGVLLPRLRVELEAVHLFRRRLPGPVADTGGEVRITAARPALCARLGRARVEVPLCGGVELGVLRAAGFGVTAPDVRRHAWVAIVGSTGVAFAVLPWLALRLRAGIALGLLRREFTLLGAPLGTTGPVDGRLALGVELRLP